MKEFSKKQDVIIDYYYSPTVNAKDGEIVPHKKKVQKLIMFVPQYVNEQELFIKVELNREMILELAAEIAVIEQTVIDMEFESLPW